MSSLALELPHIVDAQPFVPHTLEHLTQVRVFPNPLPEAAYTKMLDEYAALEGVTVQQIEYVSDGLKITGLVAFPDRITPKAHPVMIYNRGGSGDYGKLTVLNVLRSMVPFAKAGYMVFASNYRGNAGSEGVEEFGGADIADVLNLLDIATGHSGFDGTNRFMLGHSRGGMMTSLAMKHGAKLTAAISIAGIADARNLLQSENIVERIYKRRVPGFDTDPDAALIARSAVCWPQMIKAPYLLLHGDNDKDVHFEDSKALFEAISSSGGMADLEIYARGNHALLRHWAQVIPRCIGFLEQYRV